MASNRKSNKKGSMLKYIFNPIKGNMIFKMHKIR